MTSTMRIRALGGVLAGALSLVTATPVAAQEESGPPEGWMVRTDRGGHGATAEGLEFIDMSPGFHITTGPAGIFYHPAQRGEGRFRAEAEIFLFDPGNRREGFGLLLGGTALDGADQAYSYFLIRRDGSYLVKRRSGSETATIQGWTQHAAIPTWEDKADDAATVKYVLTADVGDSEVVFLVNGEEVTRVPTEALGTDGVAGLRVNHGLNLHVTRLDITSGS